MDLLQEKLIIALIGLSSGTLFAYAAKRTGFFTLSKKPSLPSPPLFALLFAFFIYFFPQIIFSPQLMEIAAHILNLSWQGGIEVNFFLTFFSLFFSTLLLFYFSRFYGFWGERGFRAKRIFQNFGVSLIGWVISFPLVMGINMLLAIFLQLLFGDNYHQEQDVVRALRSVIDSPNTFWTFALMISFVVPVGEEILFRGFLQNWISFGAGPKIAIFTSSLLFTAFHYNTSLGFANLALMVPLFLLSLLLGFFYLARKNLWIPITMHVMHNFATVLLINFNL